MSDFNQLLSYFKKVNGNSQYVNYLRSIDNANGQQTVNWIDSVIQNKGTLFDALKKFDEVFANNSKGWGQKTLSNYRTGYKKFAEVVIGLFSANTWLTRDNTSLALCQLVADNALFASQTVVDYVKSGQAGSNDNLNKGGNPYASWDRLKHIRDTKVKKGTVIPDPLPLGATYGDMIADDNTIANQAMKKAVIMSFEKSFGPLKISSYVNRFRDYEVCHIWDYPEDRRYYASIANLVLLPRAIAGLSDHSDAVKDLLRYEAFKRFKFKPCGALDPQCPDFYSKIKWRYSFQ